MNYKSASVAFRMEIKKEWMKAIENSSLGLYADEDGEIYTQGRHNQRFMGSSAFNIDDEKMTGKA